MLLRGGGSAFVELDEPAAGAGQARFYGEGGRRYPVRADDLVRRAGRLGARVREHEVVALRDPQSSRRHRLLLDWPSVAAR